MPVWSTDRGEFIGSVPSWVEFLLARRQSSVDMAEKTVSGMSLTLREEDTAENVRQLVDLLLPAVSTRPSCGGFFFFERIEHFKLDYHGRGYDEVNESNVIWSNSDAVPHHIEAMIRQLGRFWGNLPLTITKVTFSAFSLHPKLFTLLLSLLSENRHLMELNIFPSATNYYGQEFGNNNEGYSSIMRVFLNGETSRLRRLSFLKAHVTELDFETLELLKSNTHLQYLNLYDYYALGDAGASLIAEALKVNKTLKYLNVGSCGIGDQGCMALTQALSVNNTLEVLYLNGNRFGDAVVRAFAEALRVNRSLRRLGLKSSKYPGHSKETEETEEELLQVACHFLLPLELNINNTYREREILYDACAFNCGFHEKCQKLRDGTMNFSDDSFRWFLPLLGSAHPFVKQSVLFLLLRERAEIASQSYLFMMGRKQQSNDIIHCSSLNSLDFARVDGEVCATTTILGEKGKGFQSSSNSAEYRFASPYRKSKNESADLGISEETNCTFFFGILENGRRLSHKLVSYCKNLLEK